MTVNNQLQSIVERIETLEAQKAEVAEDIKAVYQEAKGNGFDVKTIRKIVAMRKKEEHARAEEEALLATYMQALDMIGHLADTPLGDAALRSIAPKAAGKALEAPESNQATQTAASIEQARQEGARAAVDGLRLTDTPYLSSDPRGKAWENGYIGANVHAAA